MLITDMPAPFTNNDDQSIYSYKYPDTPYTAPKTEINWGFWILPLSVSIAVMIGLFIGLPFVEHMQETTDSLKEALHDEIQFIESASCDELQDALLYSRIHWYNQYATERYLGLGCK